MTTFFYAPKTENRAPNLARKNLFSLLFLHRKSKKHTNKLTNNKIIF